MISTGKQLPEGQKEKQQSIVPQNSREKNVSLQMEWSVVSKAQTVKNPPAVYEIQVPSLESGRDPGEGNGNPLQYSCLENSKAGAWKTTVHRVPKSQT